MPNRLAGQNSPYLLQHSENPVDWYPWGEAALQRARAEDKPIFLSIGYAACHWCHVMAHESFEDDATAAILNTSFVCIKVDREERPDLDSIYMQATTAITGAGGWPMSVFLTPDLRPFYAGTYFPPVQRYNMPAFPDLLRALAESWRENRAQILDVAARVRQALEPAGSAGETMVLTSEIVSQAEARLVQGADRQHGGWGGAPKFPQPMAIEFLLRRAASNPAAHGPALAVAIDTLRLMARGGMYDVIGGGFARYSTDVQWLVPHFEKMLYDNAQLALTYLQAHILTGEPAFARVASETLDFVRRELMHPEGGFFSSLDADSDGAEGAYYAWTADEIRELLAQESLFDIFAAAYPVTDRGNWEDRIVLQRALDDASVASLLTLPIAQVTAALDRCRALLFKKRNGRPRPATDDKVVCSWNGLMLRAFANAAVFLGETENGRLYLDVATRNADFLLSRLRQADGLRRIWRNGGLGDQVFLDDYAALTIGLLDLYQADFNNRWFVAARELADEMIDRFAAPDSGFFDTARGAAGLLLRPKDIQDNATPAGNSMACEALLLLAGLTGEGRYRDLAEQSLGIGLQHAAHYPTAFGRWLCAADLALSGEQQLAILYPPGADPADLIRLARSAFRPNLRIAASIFPPAADAPPLVVDRPLLDDRPTAYLCEGRLCKQPTSDPAELQLQL